MLLLILSYLTVMENEKNPLKKSSKNWTAVETRVTPGCYLRVLFHKLVTNGSITDYGL